MTKHGLERSGVMSACVTSALLLLACGAPPSRAAATDCAVFDNAPCTPFDSSSCGGRACRGDLECAPTTGRCASLPRGYGQPCSVGGPDRCGAGLRCSIACGICVDEREDELASMPQEEAPPGPVTACGMSSKLVFQNWSGTVRSGHPIMRPKNDAQLRAMLRLAREGGCRVRPAGSGHSAPGVVAEDSSEGDVVIISLHRYTPSDAEWATPTLVGSGERATVRAPAGATQLDLYAAIRPDRYFLPTQTAGWLFTIGGLLSNFVHGGAFGKGLLHDHVTSLRVMLWDGTISILEEEEDLKFWRQGYGLLGIITAAEIEVERRPHFWFGTLPAQTLSGGWKRANFNGYIERIKASYSAAEFFLNPHNKEVLAVVQADRAVDTVEAPISDSDCRWHWWGRQCRPRDQCSYQYEFGDWTLSQSCRSSVRPTPQTDDDCKYDYSSSSCRQPDHCSYQFQLGDLTLEQSCRLKVPAPPDRATMVDGYRELRRKHPLLGLNGVAIGDDRLQQAGVCLASRVGLEALLVDTAMREIGRLAREAYERTNDGFFIRYVYLMKSTFSARAFL